MKRAALCVILAGGLAACDAPPSAPLITPLAGDQRTLDVVSNTSNPLSGILFNSCTPSELVQFEGSAHQVVKGDVTGPDFDYDIHLDLQGVSGVGLTSGDR